MCKVIGPLGASVKERAADWLLLRMYRGSINFMKEKNTNGKYDSALEKESSTYRETLRNYASKVTNIAA